MKIRHFLFFFFFFRQRPSARTFKFLYFLRFYRNDLKHSDDLKCIQRSSLDALHWEGETSLARGCHIFLLLSHRLIQLHKSFNHINGSKLRFFREQTNELLSKWFFQDSPGCLRFTDSVSPWSTEMKHKNIKKSQSIFKNLSWYLVNKEWI